MRLQYDLYRLPGYELEDLARSLGVSFLHVHRNVSLNRIIERLQAYGTVVLIDGNGKSIPQIKLEIEKQYGKSDIVVFNCLNYLPDTEYLFRASAQIPASFICINRKKQFKH
jgi:hypothetical protein